MIIQVFLAVYRMQERELSASAIARYARESERVWVVWISLVKC
jgi:hypothetical protein